MSIIPNNSSRAEGKSLLSICVDELEDLLAIAETPDTSLDLGLDTEDEEPNWTSDFKPVEHRRRIYLDARQQMNTEQILLLRDFFRDECETKNDLQDLTIARMFNRTTPKLQRVMEDNAFAQQIRQDASTDSREYALFGQGQLQSISNEADRFAQGQRWTLTAVSLPGFGLPAYREHVLERFFVMNAKPNEVEIRVLSDGLQIQRPAVEQFFERKIKATEGMREAQRRHNLKKVQRTLVKRGGSNKKVLPDGQQQARAFGGRMPLEADVTMLSKR